MEVELFSPCESLSIDPVTESMTLRSVRNHFFYPSFPVEIDPIPVAVRIRCDTTEQGNHTLVFKIESLAGESMGPPPTARFAPKFIPGCSFAWVGARLEIPRMRYDAAGVNRLRLEVDGKELRTCVLFILKDPSAMPSAP